MQHTRILRLPEVEQRTGLRRSAIYRYMAEGHFPRSIQITPKAIGWVEKEIDDWIESRIRESRVEVA